MVAVHALRPYQRQIAEAVFDSVQFHKGLTFSVMIARQGGKNETSAWIEAALLSAYVRSTVTAIKAAPTFHPQALISISRLKDVLRRTGIYYEFERGHIFRVGRARQLFLSAHPTGNVVGNTASLILEIDESQDVSPDKFNRDFVPMGASSNVTTVHYGTALGRQFPPRTGQAVQPRAPALRRHPAPLRVRLAGRRPAQPSLPAPRRGRTATPRQRSPTVPLPVLPHPRFRRWKVPGLYAGRPSSRAITAEFAPPFLGAVYVAGIDLAGEVEEPANGGIRAVKPSRDSTVVTIGELRSLDDGLGSKLPTLSVVEHFWWTEKPHTEIFSTLVHLLKNVWGCRRVVVDATGVGAGVAAFLRKSLGTSIVKPFTFTARSKSDLGFDLLAAVNSGRLQMYKPDGSPESHEFWSQISKARSTVRPNQTINFFVDPAQGHDDFLSSLALLVSASDYTPRRASGRLRKDYE